MDISLEQVRFRGQIFDGCQWVEFYARLAFDLLETSDNPRWLTPESLQRLASWSVKSLGSVGKEVARHLKTLKRSPVESKGITKTWRLALNPEELSLLPNQAATEAWLRSRTIDPSTRVADDTVAHLIDGLMALRGGHTERADADLRAVDRSKLLPPAFAALNTLLRFKVDVQYAEIDDLEREAELMAGTADPLSLSVHARLVASLAFLHRFQSSGHYTKALERAAARLEGTGDLATLGTVLNVLGLLSRRAGEPIRATGYLQHALALSAISQDYVTVQGTLFNLAQARIAAREVEGLPLDESAFVLIDLCLRVCREYGVGSDSVQAELLAASCARKLGHYERAKKHLADAEQFVKQLDNPYEFACWHRQRAKLAVATNDPTLNPLRDAKVAVKFFEKSGAAKEATEMHQLVERLT